MSLLEVVVLAAKCGRFVGEQGVDHCKAFVETIKALAHRAEPNPVGPAFFFKPSRAKPNFKPSVRSNVDRGDHVRQNRRMSIGHGRHQERSADARRACKKHRERRPTLETWIGRLSEERIQMIEEPARFKDREFVGHSPRGVEAIPSRLVLGR